MNLFQLHDKRIDPSTGRMSSYFNQLFLLSGPDYFRYCILDTDRNTYIAMADYQADQKLATPTSWQTEMEGLCLKDELLNRKYPAVVAGLDTPYHTILPASLYDPGQLESHLRLNFEMPEGLIIHADQLTEMDAWNIWAVSPERQETLKNHFSQVILLHSSTALLKAFSMNLKQDSGHNIIHLHFLRNRFDLAVLSDNTLRFFNTFHFDNDEDILYFTLYAAEQLKLRPGESRLRLSGDIEIASDTVGLLREFLPETNFGSRPEGFGYSPLFDFPAHKYPSLFSLALCGS